MAKYIPLPKTLEGTSRYVIQDLIVATEERFKGDLFGEINSSLNESYTTPDGKLHWNTTKELLNYVLDITRTSDIRSANRVLYQNLSRAPEQDIFVPKEAPEQVDANIASKATRDAQEAERQRREKIEEENKISKENVKRSIEDSIKKQEEIYDQEIQRTKQIDAKLKSDNQKIYYKVNDVSPDLRQQAEANPKQFTEDVSVQFKDNPILKNLSSEDAQNISKRAALTTYQVVTGNSPLTQAEIIKKIISDPKNQESLGDIGSILIDQKIAQFELARQFLNLPENVKIEFSDTPQEGFKEFNLSEITSEHLQNLNGQNIFLDSLSGFGADEIKSKIVSRSSGWINNQIAKLPANSAFAQLYKSEVVQAGLSSLGIIEGVPLIAVEGSWIGRLAISSGLGPAVGLIQAKTGINLGVKVATKAITSTGAKVAVEAATGTTLAAAITATFAWTGPLAPVIGIVGAFLIESVAVKAVGKIINVIKDNIHKVKDFIIIGSAALFGGVIGIATGFGALSGGLIGGFAGWGAAKLSTGGLGGLRASANIGAKNVMNVGWAIGATALAGIGGPILTILLVFPLVVALILFIINSGAYVVPPSVSSIVNINEYVDVQKEAMPPGPFQNSDLPLKIKYTITITAKKEALTNVTVKDECIVITKSGQQNCQAPPITVPGGTIAVGTPFIFSYEANYNSSYKDSLVLNTITVSANVLSQTDRQTESGGASITIGEPPSACLSIDGPWPAGYKLNLEKAKAKLVGSFSSYVSKVCSSFNKISLLYEPGSKEQYWGWNDGQKSGTATIHFYSLGVKNEADALYTVAHELGHSLANGTKTASIYSRYTAFPGIKSEAPYCFYSATTSWNANESMPEAIALRVVEPRCGSVQQKWPTHNNFLKKYVFN